MFFRLLSDLLLDLSNNTSPLPHQRTLLAHRRPAAFEHPPFANKASVPCALAACAHAKKLVVAKFLAILDLR